MIMFYVVFGIVVTLFGWFGFQVGALCFSVFGCYVWLLVVCGGLPVVLGVDLYNLFALRMFVLLDLRCGCLCGLCLVVVYS